jgi:hypothetical protein
VNRMSCCGSPPGLITGFQLTAGSPLQEGVQHVNCMYSMFDSSAVPLRGPPRPFDPEISLCADASQVQTYLLCRRISGADTSVGAEVIAVQTYLCCRRICWCRNICCADVSLVQTYLCCRRICWCSSICPADVSLVQTYLRCRLILGAEAC